MVYFFVSREDNNLLSRAGGRKSGKSRAGAENRERSSEGKGVQSKRRVREDHVGNWRDGLERRVQERGGIMGKVGVTMISMWVASGEIVVALVVARAARIWP